MIPLTDAIQLIGDQPMTCPLCGCRTEFDEHTVDGVYFQQHTCPNEACGLQFRAEEDND